MKHSKRRKTNRRSSPGRFSHLIEESSQDPGEVLDALNSIPVTAEDLWRIGEALARRHGFSRTDVLAAVMERVGDAEVERGSAIFFRFEALTAFVAREPNLQWDNALIAAAAVEPIVPIDNELTFQSESFLRRVLEFYASAGPAPRQ